MLSMTLVGLGETLDRSKTIFIRELKLNRFYLPISLSMFLFILKFWYYFEDGQRTNYNLDQRCRAHLFPGQCKLSSPKYVFNKDQKVCQQKLFGDCSGDDDLFDSEAECRIACLWTMGPGIYFTHSTNDVMIKKKRL